MTKAEKEERKRIRKALKEWSRDVRTADGWVCAYCGQPHKYLNAHHLLPKEVYKQYQFDRLNGISLCPMKHHKKFAHWNGLAFTIWFMENRPEQFAYVKSLLKGANTGGIKEDVETNSRQVAKKARCGKRS